TLVIILVIALVAIAAAGGYYYVSSRRQTKDLRGAFGSEYDRAVAQTGSRRQAEAELKDRQERVEHPDIRPLPDTQRQYFADQWRSVQSRFVDDPVGAVRDADDLVNEVMTARGYPMDRWEQRANDVSVDHPQVVAHYRAALKVRQGMGNGTAATEDR